MQTPPRMPQSSQPDEPGWWLAVDGLWYPPESAPVSPAPPVAPRPGMGSPGDGRWQGRAAVPPFPQPGYQNQSYPPAAPRSSLDRAGEGSAITSLVLGIATLVSSFWLVAALGLWLGLFANLGIAVISLFLGLSARNAGAGGMAVAGITVSAVSCALTVVWILDLMTLANRFNGL